MGRHVSRPRARRWLGWHPVQGDFLGYQELLWYFWRDLRWCSTGLVCGDLCSELLDLLLELSVSLDHPLYAARSTTVLQLLDLLLQIGNVFLGSLSDVSLGLSVVRPFPCQLGLTQVSDGSLPATGTSIEASVYKHAGVDEKGSHKPFFLGSSSSIAAGLFESRLLDIGVEDILCVAKPLVDGCCCCCCCCCWKGLVRWILSVQVEVLLQDPKYRWGKLREIQGMRIEDSGNVAGQAKYIPSRG